MMNPWNSFLCTFHCLFLIPIIAAHLDEDMERGMAFRRQEFNNLDDDDYRKNIEQINALRHKGENWSVESNCRMNSADLSEKQCINPNSIENNLNESFGIGYQNNFSSEINPTKCFSVQINYEYVDRSGIFGEFPEQLEFLRHFPRCWLRLAPLVCLGHFRPCSLAIKNSQQTKYVLLEQFPAATCRNMLEHCPFAAPHLLKSRNKFPSYLNCEAHLYGRNRIRNSDGGNGREEITKKSAIYVEDCKVNEIMKHPELAELAKQPFQCLWPLVKIENEVDGGKGERPLIDACYMPCQTPMFPSDSLRVYHHFFIIFWFIIIFFAVLLFTLIILMYRPSEKEKTEIYDQEKHQENQQQLQYFPTFKTLPWALSITIISTLIAPCLIALIFGISILPNGQHRVLGEWSTCLPNVGNSTAVGVGGQHRRPNEFKMAESKDNSFCAFQAFFLDFFYNFTNFSLFLLFSKIILLHNLALSNSNFKFICNFLPKWNSPLLPIAPFSFGLLTFLFDLYFNEISVDPVNGMCHFFLNGNKLLTARIFFPLIAFIVMSIFVYYANVCYKNSVSSYKRNKKIRKDWIGNNGFDIRNSGSRNFSYSPVTTTTTTTFQPQGCPEQNPMINHQIPPAEVGHPNQDNQQRNEQEIAADNQNTEFVHAGNENEFTAAGIGISLNAQIQNDERQPLRSDPTEQQNENDGNPEENANDPIVVAKNRWHLQKFVHRTIDWLRKLSPNWIGSICFCLLLLRLLCSQMQMEVGEEARLIMKSIDCSINRTMSERIPLDWIDKQQYSGITETNPHIRREQLNGKTAARYCELDQLDLRWYWTVSILNGLNFLLIAVFLASLLLHSADFLTLEHEFEMKEKIKMEIEMQEIITHGRRSRPWHGRNPLRADDQSSHSSNYDQIPYDEPSVISSMIPPSTVPPNESRIPPSTVPPNESRIPPSTVPPNESRIPPSTVPPNESRIPPSTVPPNESRIPPSTVPPNESRIPPSTVPPNESRIPPSTVPPNESRIPPSTVPPNESRIPPSTVPPNESRTHPTQSDGLPNASITCPSPNNAIENAYSEYSPAASSISNKTWPLMQHLQQQQFNGQYTQLNAGHGPCTSQQAETLYAYLRQMSGQQIYSSPPDTWDTVDPNIWQIAQLLKKMAPQLPRRAHSEPGDARIRHRSKSKEQEEVEGDGQRPGKTATQQNGKGNSRRSRRHKLNIRGLHESRKRAASGSGSMRSRKLTEHIEDAWSDLNATERRSPGYYYTFYKGNQNSPSESGSSTNMPSTSQQAVDAANLQQVVQLLAPLAVAENLNFRRMLVEHELVSILQQQQQIAPFLYPVENFAAMMNAQQPPPPPQQQNEEEEEEEENPSTTSPTEDEESASNSSAESGGISEEERYVNVNVGEVAEAENSDLDPSSSSIPSSEIEDEENDADSNDFDSNVEDEYERQRWEERMKKTEATTTASENS